MTTIRELKEKVETNTFTDKFIIFECPDSYFLADQYIKQIAQARNLEIKYDNSNPVINNYLSVITIDELKDDITIFDNLIVKCKKMLNKKYNNSVVTLPKLEDWQIRDYAIANLPGLTKADVDWFCKTLNYDIYAIENEIIKLKVFDEKSISTIFKQLKEQGEFNNSSSDTFQLVGSLLKRDKPGVQGCLPFNDNAMGVVKLLLDNIKIIISIQAQDGKTPAILGITEGRYNAIKRYNTGYYSNDELLDIYKKLYNIKEKLQDGLMDTDKVLDYVLLTML